MNKKVFLIDIDGTICDDIPNEESDRFATAEHFPDALETINKWYDEGHNITFFTARKSEHREVTEKWLKDKGFKYHGLITDKPRAVEGEEYHWIDNKPVRATTYLNNFTDLVKKTKEVEVFKKSEPLKEGKVKSNIKESGQNDRVAPNPPPSRVLKEGEEPSKPNKNE